MIKNLFFLLGVALFFTACSDGGFGFSDTDKKVAEAYGQTLYSSDLQEIIPSGTSKKDSIDMAQNFINSWIRQVIILHNAEKNLSESNINFDKQINDYKNSLIIYAYEKELIKQKLDTIVDIKAISEHYEQNKKEFILREHAIKAKYVKVPLQSEMIKKIRVLIRSNKEEDTAELSNLCQAMSAEYKVDPEKWYTYTEIFQPIPNIEVNPTIMLKYNNYFETQDSLFNYFVAINSYKLEGDIAPLALETERIRSIIFNKRKVDLITTFQEKLYKDAETNKEFEIFQ